MRYRLTGKGKLKSQRKMCQSQEFLLEQTLMCFPHLPYPAAGQHLNWMHRCLMYQFYICRALMCSCHIRHKQQHWECTECICSFYFTVFWQMLSWLFCSICLGFCLLSPLITSDWSRQFFLKKWNNTFNVRFCAQRLKQQTWVNKEGLLPIIAELGFLGVVEPVK